MLKYGLKTPEAAAAKDYTSQASDGRSLRINNWIRNDGCLRNGSCEQERCRDNQESTHHDFHLFLPFEHTQISERDACRILTIDLRHPTATLFPYAAALIPGIAQTSIPVSSS